MIEPGPSRTRCTLGEITPLGVAMFTHFSPSRLMYVWPAFGAHAVMMVS